jgi:hypothetical protein
MCSGMWRVAEWVDSDVSTVLSPFIFRVKQSWKNRHHLPRQTTTGNTISINVLDPLRVWHYSGTPWPLRYVEAQCTFETSGTTHAHTVTSLKAWVLSNTAMRISKVASWNLIFISTITKDGILNWFYRRQTANHKGKPIKVKYKCGKEVRTVSRLYSSKDTTSWLAWEARLCHKTNEHKLCCY